MSNKTPRTEFANCVTAAAVVRNFGKYREVALRTPLAITRNGTPSVVMLAAEEYARLKALDDRQALAIEDLPDHLVKALMTAKAPASGKQYNDEVKPRRHGAKPR